MTDEQLVIHYLESRQVECGVTLLARYDKFMNYIIYSPLKNFKTNEEEKEELKAEIILYFFEVLPLYDENIGLFKVFIENKIRNFGRKYSKKLMKYKNGHLFMNDKELDLFEQKFEEMEETDPTYQYVECLIEKLPPRQSQVARLRILENYRFHQIGEVLYPTKDAKLRHAIVDKNFKEALKKLKKWIEE